MRPIDADALEKNICESCYVDCESKGHKPIGACAYMLFIDDMPTLDVQSVVHSRWTEEFKLHYYQYCYHCGARMDN